MLVIAPVTNGAWSVKAFSCQPWPPQLLHQFHGWHNHCVVGWLPLAGDAHGWWRPWLVTLLVGDALGWWPLRWRPNKLYIQNCLIYVKICRISTIMTDGVCSNIFNHGCSLQWWSLKNNHFRWFGDASYLSGQPNTPLPIGSTAIMAAGNPQPPSHSAWPTQQPNSLRQTSQRAWRKSALPSRGVVVTPRQH